MICPFCREKDTSVVDSRPTEDGTAIEEEEFVLAEVDNVSQLLKEYNLES